MTTHQSPTPFPDLCVGVRKPGCTLLKPLLSQKSLRTEAASSQMGAGFLHLEPLPCCLPPCGGAWNCLQGPCHAAADLSICHGIKNFYNKSSLLTNPSPSASWMPPSHFQRHRTVGCPDSHQHSLTMSHSAALTWHGLSPTRKHFKESVAKQKSVFYCAKQLAHGQSYPPSLCECHDEIKQEAWV